MYNFFKTHRMKLIFSECREIYRERDIEKLEMADALVDISKVGEKKVPIMTLSVKILGGNYTKLYF